MSANPDEDIRSTGDLIHYILRENRLKAKGRYKALSEETRDMDPKTRYKRDQPSDLDFARFWWQEMYLYAAEDPQDRELMLICAHIISYLESEMDRFGAGPDVMVDDKGSWPILMQTNTSEGGGIAELLKDFIGGGQPDNRTDSD